MIIVLSSIAIFCVITVSSLVNPLALLNQPVDQARFTVTVATFSVNDVAKNRYNVST